MFIVFRQEKRAQNYALYIIEQNKVFFYFPENEALTHGGSGNHGWYPGYSGQTDIHIKQIYRRIRLHHMLVLFSYFLVHWR